MLALSISENCLRSRSILFKSVTTAACLLFSLSAWATENKLIPDDPDSYDFFGRSVAVFGDTALIGAPFDDIDAKDDAGSVYVFVFNGTNWVQEQKLTASDASDYDNFGRSVTLTADTALIGAPYGDSDTLDDTGSAYVFVRSGTTWTEQKKLTASNASAWDEFGSSVSLSGETALVGATLGDNTIGDDTGAAYVFIRSGTTPTWTEQQKLIASDADPADGFGSAVSLSGDTALVGAYFINEIDSAYVFERSGTTWSEQQKLSANVSASFDRFGYSVAVSGDTALIGAPGDNFDYAGAGSAYVFERTGASWSQQQILTPSDGDPSGFGGFGVSVALDIDKVLVGNGFLFSGQASAYVFTHDGTTWDEQQKLTPSDVGSDGYGQSVALTANSALVGASYGDSTSILDTGAAYIYALTNPNGGAVEKDIIAAEGGTVSTPDENLSLELPPNALDVDSTISVSQTTIDATAQLGSSGEVVAAYTFLPSPYTFQEPITLSIKADVTSLLASNPDAIIDIYYLVNETFEPQFANCNVEEDRIDPGILISTCTVDIQHFSTYTMLALSDIDNDGVPDFLNGIEDACPFEDATGFDMDHDGCIDSFSGLASLVSNLVIEEVIPATMENSLLSKIHNAEKTDGKENLCAAANELEAFKKQIDAQTNKKISIEVADKVKVYVDSVALFLLSGLPDGETCN